MADRPRTLLIALLVAAAVGSARAQAEPPGSVRPPPRGSWITDRTGTLRADTLARVNAIASALAAAAAGQLGVAVVRSTDGRDSLAYATELANRWGVGHADRHDGALLLVALSDRQMAIALGDGVDGEEEVEAARAIISDVLRPAFRAGRVDEGIIDGAEAIAKLLRDRAAAGGDTETSAPVAVLPPAEALEIPSPRHAWVMDVDGAVPADVKDRLNGLSWEMEAAGEAPIAWLLYGGDRLVRADALIHRALEQHPILRDHWIVVATPRSGRVLVRPPQGASDSALQAHLESAQVAWGEVFATMDARAAAELAERTRSLTRSGRFPRPATQLAAEFVRRHQGGFGAGGLVALVAGAFGLRRYLRFRPRRCEHCGAPRQRLDEEWDDQHLSDGERREEQLRSVDYDVWWCGISGDALTVAYRNWLSSYKKCEACHQVTAKHSTRTICHATYDHGGEVEVTEACQHCGHRRVYTRHTPRLTRSTSTSSSRSSFSSASSRSSSFGGGRSSGRGSSGGW